MIWRLLTDLGDFLVASAVIAVMSGWSAARLERRVALSIGQGWLLLTVAVTGLKLVSQRFGAPLEHAKAVSLSEGAPSGHAAMALLAFGGMALVLRSAGRPAWRVLGPIACGAVIVVVAVSRVTLDTHAPLDVIAGLVIGGASLLPLRAALNRREAAAPPAPVWELVALATAVAAGLLLSGIRLPSTLVL